MAAGRDSAAPGPRTREPRKLDAVFDRGGVKGIGMVGAISVIEREGYEFVNLAGLSTGAMIATLLGAGYTAAELKEIIMELDLRHFRDAGPVGACRASVRSSTFSRAPGSTGATRSAA